MYYYLNCDLFLEGSFEDPVKNANNFDIITTSHPKLAARSSLDDTGSVRWQHF